MIMKENRIQSVKTPRENIECDERETRDDGCVAALRSSYIIHSSIVLCLLFSVFCLLTFSGCQQSAEGPSLTDQIEQLTQEKAQLQRQIEQTNTENNELKSRVEILSSIGGENRIDDFSLVQDIKIGRYTNFYDKDKDGKKEKLIVYVQPIDAEGDKIKAAGEIDVQLWNLNNSAGEALLGSWQTGLEELRKMWFATVVTLNYRLIFDIPEAVVSFHEPLTVKVTFKDHLTGKTLEAQKVIEPSQTADNTEPNA
jgi:hypothetical protein